MKSEKTNSTIESISHFLGIGMITALATVSASANIITAQMLLGQPEPSGSDYFTYTDAAGTQWSLAILRSSSLHSDIVVPTINGSPIQGYLFNAPTVVLRDQDPNPNLHSAVLGVIDYNGDYVFAFDCDYNTAGFWVPSAFIPYVGPIVALATSSPIGAPDWYLASGTGQFWAEANTVPEPATTAVSSLLVLPLGIQLCRHRLSFKRRNENGVAH